LNDKYAYNKIQKPYKHGIEWPITLTGAIATTVILSGLIPPYFELAKRSGRVVGISTSFWDTGSL
jgi:hypothetical protein